MKTKTITFERKELPGNQNYFSIFTPQKDILGCFSRLFVFSDANATQIFLKDPRTLASPLASTLLYGRYSRATYMLPIQKSTQRFMR